MTNLPTYQIYRLSSNQLIFVKDKMVIGHQVNPNNGLTVEFYEDQEYPFRFNDFAPGIELIYCPVNEVTDRYEAEVALENLLDSNQDYKVAFTWLVSQVKNLANVDNFRVAKVGDPEAEILYQKIRDMGCCGEVDTVVKGCEINPSLRGTQWKLGCNYGH